MLYRVMLSFSASASEPQTAMFDLDWPKAQPPLAVREFLAFPEPGTAVSEQLHAQITAITHQLPYTAGEAGRTYAHCKIVNKVEQQLRATPPADVARRLARFPWVGPLLLVDAHGSEMGSFTGTEQTGPGSQERRS